MSLFYLLTSYDESLIYNGAVSIGIPSKFVPLILISKKIIEPKVILLLLLLLLLLISILLIKNGLN